MAETGKRKNPTLRFAEGMLLYAGLFLLLIVVGMRLFWGYIAEYEATRDNHAIEAYMDSLDDEHISAIADAFPPTLDAEVQNPEDSHNAVVSVLRGELHTRRAGGESNANRAVYKIFSGEREIGQVTFTRPDNPRFGFSHWTLEGESYDFSWLCGSGEITVPDGWTVSVGSTVLGENHVAQTQIPYAYLKDFYGKGLPELYQRTYRVENYVGEVPFEVKNSFGEPVDPSALSEDLFLDNCTPEEKAADEAFVRAFLPYYIECLANTKRDAQGNYDAIRRFLVDGGSLDLRLRDAIAGQVYAHSQGEEILSLELDRHVHLGGAFYLVEIHYELASKSQWEAQPTVSDNHAQIILQLTDSGLLARSFY